MTPILCQLSYAAHYNSAFPQTYSVNHSNNEFGWNLPKANHILNPVRDIEPTYTLHRAGTTILAQVSRQIQGEQEILGSTEIAVAIRIHVGAHQIRNGQLLEA